jgi:Leucine-rich repeat (LRR) protein
MQKLYLLRRFKGDINDDYFDSRAHLSELYLGENKLTIVKKSWFKNLHRLYLLCLSKNKINEIDDDSSFDSLVNLKELFLTQNELPRVKEAWFKNLRRLTSLSLSKIK